MAWKPNRWRCDCGWEGLSEDMKRTDNYRAVCPQCGKSGTFNIVHEKPEAPTGSGGQS